MSGFEMIEKLSAAGDYMPKIIMLTGHDDFEHAKQAIKYQVFDYLIKPVMPDDIMAALSKVKEAIDNDLEFKSRFISGIESLKSTFIEQILHNSEIAEEYLANKQSEFNINLHSKYYAVIRLSIFDYPSVCRTQSHDTINGFKNAVTEMFFKTFSRCQASHFNDSRIYFLVLSEFDDKEILLSDCNHILDALGEDFRFFICISEFAKNLSDLSALTQQAKSCEKYSFCCSKSAVLSYTDIISSVKNVFTSKALSDIENETKTLKHITVGDWHGCIDNLYNEIKKFDYYEPNYIKQLVYNVTNNILSYILSDNTVNSIAENNDTDNIMWMNILNTQSLEELFLLCHEIADKFKDITAASVSNRSHLLSEQIKKYISENYAEPISTSEIAKKLYLSSAYLGRVFYKENGIFFKDYLKEFRMNKARELLLTGNYKVYEAAVNVGYKDIKTFRQTFIEQFGISPSSVISATNSHR